MTAYMFALWDDFAITVRHIYKIFLLEGPAKHTFQAGLAQIKGGSIRAPQVNYMPGLLMPQKLCVFGRY
jgi:hypothetical protein